MIDYMLQLNAVCLLSSAVGMSFIFPQQVLKCHVIPFFKIKLSDSEHPVSHQDFKQLDHNCDYGEQDECSNLSLSFRPSLVGMILGSQGRDTALWDIVGTTGIFNSYLPVHFQKGHCANLSSTWNKKSLLLLPSPMALSH